MIGGGMNELAARDVAQLAQEVGAPRLSLFLPLTPRSRATRLRVDAKNALLRADRALRAAGLAGARLLGLVEEALRQPRMVKPGHAGLAVFADTSGVRQYHVPVRVPKMAVVGDRFTVTPVLSTPYVAATDRREARPPTASSARDSAVDGRREQR